MAETPCWEAGGYPGPPQGQLLVWKMRVLLPNAHLGLLKLKSPKEVWKGDTPCDGHPLAAGSHVIPVVLCLRAHEIPCGPLPALRPPPPGSCLPPEFWEPPGTETQRDVSETFENEGERVATEAMQRGDSAEE